MKKGETQGVSFAVLTVTGVIGVLAVLTLLLNQPTGNIAQGDSIYPTVTADMVGIVCTSSEVFYLGSESTLDVYCCKEDMIGENKCKKQQRIFRNS